MILVDSNLLIYAASPSLPQHERARRWLDDRLNGSARVGLPWPSLLSFLRITGNPRVFEPPLPVGEGWALVLEWLACPTAWIPSPGRRHRELLDELIGDSLPSRLVSDAHLAALALEHGLILASTDRDFATFPGLRWENPIAR